MTTADVVIIGGGIVGSSIAFHLAEAGCTDVLIVEREAHQGLGSTGKSAGGVRAQFATEVNIRMSLFSIDFFKRYQKETGQDLGYRPHGYLFVATEQRHLDYLKTNREKQLSCGLENVRMLSRDDIVGILPQMRADDIVGGSFCPTDGFVDPYSVMTAFSSRARELGARLWLGTEITAIDVERSRVSGVMTSRGRVASRVVVNAGGPWAGVVARLAGLEIPVTPLRRQLVHTQPFDQLPPRLPMVIDMSNGFHFRPEGPGFLLAWPDEHETTGFNTQFDPEFIEKILIRAVNRVPCFAEAEVNPRRCWAGLYEVTPDHHAIIGAAPGVEGLFLANGFSGHGVMHSPATGKIVSEQLLFGRAVTIDAAQLRPERFAEGQLLEETAVL
jgi:sarcosine oxidase subunit beta